MKTEIEAKFLSVDFEKVRASLLDLGGVCKSPMRLMRRVLIQTPNMTKNGRQAFIRIRDEGDGVTVTFKDHTENSLTGAKEIEIKVSDYDDAIAIFAAADLNYQSYLESRRETWELDGVEIMLDDRPWVDDYIEIEGPTEDSVKETAKKLGFEWADAVFGSMNEVVKRQYPWVENPNIGGIAVIKFDEPIPEILKKDKI